MPRARVHARRDLVALRPLLASAGLAVDGAFEVAYVERHRSIDRNTSEEDAELHFMRGPEEEAAPKALAEALDHAQARSWRAVEAMVAAREGPGDPEVRSALVRRLADALHVVRDSYCSGHATREGHTGPVVAMRAWAREGRAFGIRHALLHDLRFEPPFAWLAPEVPASDRAVEELVGLIADAATSPAPRRKARFTKAWKDFVTRRFLPRDAAQPQKSEAVGAAKAAAVRR